MIRAVFVFRSMSNRRDDEAKAMPRNEMMQHQTIRPVNDASVSIRPNRNRQRPESPRMFRSAVVTLPNADTQNVKRPHRMPTPGSIIRVVTIVRTCIVRANVVALTGKNIERPVCIREYRCCVVRCCRRAKMTPTH